MDQVIFGGLLSEPPQVTDSFTGVIYIFDESRELDSQGGLPGKIALKLWNGVETKKMFLASASLVDCVVLNYLLISLRLILTWQKSRSLLIK